MKSIKTFADLKRERTEKLYYWLEKREKILTEMAHANPPTEEQRIQLAETSTALNLLEFFRRWLVSFEAWVQESLDFCKMCAGYGCPTCPQYVIVYEGLLGGENLKDVHGKTDDNTAKSPDIDNKRDKFKPVEGTHRLRGRR